jgi:hypothetical protein
VERHLIKISFVMKIEYGIIYDHIYMIDLINRGQHLALRIRLIKIQKIKQFVEQELELELTSQRAKKVCKE